MFAARRLLNPTKSAAKSATVRANSSSSAATVPGFLYNNVWMKSTPLYIGYIFAGAVVVELFYGVATNAIFSVINKGVCSPCYNSLQLCYVTVLFKHNFQFILNNDIMINMNILLFCV